jgi:hypothetical protein
MTNEEIIQEVREVREMDERKDKEARETPEEKAYRCGVEAERAACIELLNKSRTLYERYMHEAREQEYGLGKNPSRPYVHSREWFAKMTAIEYAILVIGKWRDSERFREDHMPLPF